MGSEFTFYDYVDDEGRNVVHRWLESIPKGAKAKFNNRLLHLEGTPAGGWTRPLVDTLDGSCDGLFEVRVSLSGRQYRILAFHTPDRKPTLLHCFIKSGKRVPDAECERARLKKVQVETDAMMHRVEHDYG